MPKGSKGPKASASADDEGSSDKAPGEKERTKPKDPAVAPRDVAAAAALGQWRKIAEWLQDGGLPNAWYVSSWGTRWTLLMAAAAGADQEMKRNCLKNGSNGNGFSVQTDGIA